MALRISWVRYGPPAAEALRDAVAAAKGGDPLAPVTVVVPTNAVGVAARRLLAGGSVGPVCGRGVGLAAVTFLTPARLAELLAAPILAGAGRRPVSTPVVAAALRTVLADDPGVFGPVAAHPATEAALVGAYRELRDLSPPALHALAGAGPRASDFVRLCTAAAGRLAERWYDEHDLMAATAHLLRGRRGRATAAGLGAVVVHLPQRLTRSAAAMLAAAGSRADVPVLVGATGDARADAEVLASVARLAPPPLPPVGAEGVVAAGRTRIVTTSDADDEVRAAVRAVVTAAEAGTPLARIAVLHASPVPYARLVAEHLAAAGVPSNGASVVPLASRVAGRWLLHLLALPDRGLRREDVFAWLASAPVRHDGKRAPVVAWERLSRQAGVVAGRSDWDRRLATLAADLAAEADAADADPDAPAWLAERDREEAARAEALRSLVVGLADELGAAAATPRRWGEHAAWATGLLRRGLGGDAGRLAWPADERKAAERVEAALQRLAAMDAVEGPVGLPVFARTLELELESDLGRVGRLGEGVLVAPVSLGVGVDLDLVVVLGLVEGSFPAPVADDPVLPDAERRRTAGELPLRRQRVARDHHQLLAVLAGARRHVLAVPRGDLRRSSERVPSRWVLELASELAGTRVWSDDLLRAGAGGVDHMASFDAGLRRPDASPATGTEHRLRALLAGLDPGDPVVAAGAAVVAARRSDAFTRFDGNLAGLAVPSPADGVTSPTRLERWAVCPFAYLVENVLRARPVESPEEELAMSAAHKGSLVHEALERFVLETLALPPAEQPAPGDRWRPEDRQRLARIAGEVCDRYEERGLTGRAVFWRRDRALVLAELRRFLDADDDHRARHRTRPVAAELAFGFPGATLGPVAIPLPDGRAVRFRGKADRVDAGEDGSRHVVDYKTGGVREAEKLCAEEPDLRGTKLQLAVYGAAGAMHAGDAATPVHAEYWFVSRKGGFRRIGYPVDAEVLARVGATLGTMVAGIEAGVFPSRPSPGGTSRPWVECPACDPDGLGTAELRRRWDRKRADAAVAPYAALAEPLDLAPGDALEVVDG
jgi:ATP-dependent helicase/nuclease subunit B